MTRRRGHPRYLQAGQRLACTSRTERPLPSRPGPPSGGAAPWLTSRQAQRLPRLEQRPRVCRQQRRRRQAAAGGGGTLEGEHPRGAPQRIGAAAGGGHPCRPQLVHSQSQVGKSCAACQHRRRGGSGEGRESGWGCDGPLHRSTARKRSAAPQPHLLPPPPQCRSRRRHGCGRDQQGLAWRQRQLGRAAGWGARAGQGR